MSNEGVNSMQRNYLNSLNSFHINDLQTMISVDVAHFSTDYADSPSYAGIETSDVRPSHPMPQDPLTARHDDLGPFYVETVDLSATIVEPFNTASATLFILVAIVWVVRLWGRFRLHPFLTACLPLLLVGGIGGTLYHATRASKLYWLADVVPISLLGVLISVYLWLRLAPRWAYLIGLIALLLVVNLIGRFTLPVHWAINLSYVSMAVPIIGLMMVALIRTNFEHSGWVWMTWVLFGFAFFFRIIDVLRPPVLPMGTHWLWHTFGALTTMTLAEYLYRIEGRVLNPLPHGSSTRSAYPG